MDSKFSEKIVDVKFIGSKTIDKPKDHIVLRVRIQGEGVRADAVVPLEVTSYVHPSDGTDLLQILADDSLPRTIEKVRTKGFWPKKDEPKG